MSKPMSLWKKRTGQEGVSKLFRASTKAVHLSKKEASTDSVKITGPTDVVRRVHVDQNWNWTGEDPESTFKICRKLGEGAYGSVYKAIHKDSKFVIALKTIWLKANQEDFKTEIEILKKCKHSNIVQLYGCWLKPDEVWILMDYCELGSVTDMMKVYSVSFTEDQLKAILFFVTQGLVYLHSQKIIHRDLKSANILMSAKGEVKIADFGVSSQLESTLGKANTIIGTPNFISPEVLEGKKYSANADIWSLGIITIEMAQRKPPYFDDIPMRAMYRIATEDPPQLDDPSKYSKSLSTFIASCLVKDPTKRPSAVEVFASPFLQDLKAPSEVIQDLIAAYKLEVPDDDEEEELDIVPSSKVLGPVDTIIGTPTLKQEDPEVAGLKALIAKLSKEIDEVKHHKNSGEKEMEDLTQQLKLLDEENRRLKELIKRQEQEIESPSFEKKVQQMSLVDIVTQMKEMKALEAKLDKEKGTDKRRRSSNKKERKTRK